MIEIQKKTPRYLVCVKPAGLAAQGTQTEAMPQMLAAQPLGVAVDHHGDGEIVRHPAVAEHGLDVSRL